LLLAGAHFVRERFSRDAPRASRTGGGATLSVVLLLVGAHPVRERFSRDAPRASRTGCAPTGLRHANRGSRSRVGRGRRVRDWR
jgi:hypothetical protein